MAGRLPPASTRRGVCVILDWHCVCCSQVRDTGRSLRTNDWALLDACAHSLVWLLLSLNVKKKNLGSTGQDTVYLHGLLLSLAQQQFLNQRVATSINWFPETGTPGGARAPGAGPCRQ